MIRFMISVAFALAVATSAEAMSPAPLHEPDAMITQIRKARPAMPGPQPNTNQWYLPVQPPTCLPIPTRVYLVE